MTRLRPRVAIVAASRVILGGQAVQAQLLKERLDADGWKGSFLPINPRFPTQLGWANAREQWASVYRGVAA